MVVELAEPHAVQHRLDFDAEVVAVARGDALLQALRPRREDAEVGIGGAHRPLGLVEAGEKLLVLFKHFLHRGVDGEDALEPARLLQIADTGAVFLQNRAAVGGEFAHEKAQKRGLALAVSAQKADALLFVQLKRRILDDGDAVEAECDVVERKEHNAASAGDTVGMKTKLTELRRLEEELKAASPAECAKLTKKLVRLKAEIMGE